MHTLGKGFLQLQAPRTILAHGDIGQQRAIVTHHDNRPGLSRSGEHGSGVTGDIIGIARAGVLHHTDNDRRPRRLGINRERPGHGNIADVARRVDRFRLHQMVTIGQSHRD